MCHYTQPKTCSKCRQQYPATKEFFYAEKTNKDGLRSSCKRCEAERQRIADGYYENTKNRAKDAALERGNKICSKCEQELPETLEYFMADKRGINGLMSICKTCRREQKAIWAANNPEAYKAMKRNSHIRNRKKNNERSACWNAAHRERSRKNSLKNYYTNKAPYFARANMRIHKRRANGGSFTIQEVRDLYDWQGGVCLYCGTPLGDSYHKDHYIPIDRGGDNTIHNIVLACESCNLSKSNKLPWLFDQRCM